MSDIHSLTTCQLAIIRFLPSIKVTVTLKRNSDINDQRILIFISSRTPVERPSNRNL